MNVLIVTLGSRGDVQPFVALGTALRKRGHAVTLCTSDRFASFAADFDLDFVPADGALVELLESDEGKELLEDIRSLWGVMRSTRRLFKRVPRMVHAFLNDVWQAAQAVRPDLIVFGSKGTMASAVAARLGCPAVLVMPLPQLVPTGELPAIGFPRWPLGPLYNRATHGVVNTVMRLYAGMLNAFRVDTLGLPKARGTAALYADLAGRPYPVMHCYSPSILPRPADWPAHASVDGFWFLERTDAWQPDARLARFLEAGAPPVCVGFGSMAGKHPARVTAAVIAALEAAGARGVLLTGWGGLRAGALPDTVHVADSVPHDWLLPRCSAVLHHGGAGTTGAGLRAGKPTLICPFGLDQPFWGAQVHALGLGPRPVPQRQLRRRGIDQAVADLVGNGAYARRAAELATQMAADPTADDAAATLEALAAAAPRPTGEGR